MLFPRYLTGVIEDRLQSEPVVVVNGPRSVGKSTVLHEIAHRVSAPVFDFDDIGMRSAVQADPESVTTAARPVLVDEFQREPNFLDAVKLELSKGAQPGSFLLTGSTRYLSQPTISQSLTGRAHVLTLWPLSQGELEGFQEDFLDRLFEEPETLATSQPSTTTRSNYIDKVLAGGFPLVVLRETPERRNRWVRDYVTLVLERDTLEIRKVRQRKILPEFLRVLAAQTGQVLNVAEAAKRVDLERSVAGDYLALLEAVFLVQRLPAWGRTLGSQTRSHPKLHVVDSALGAWLLRLNEVRLSKADPTALSEYGHLLESFVVGEIRKQTEWASLPVTLGHYRTSKGVEVDVVLEADDGRVAGIEVKAGSRITATDLNGLASMRDRLGPDFVAGIVLYTGRHSYKAQDKIWVLPVDTLWKSADFT